ncbi:MAG: hypothetical protein KatS3mg110_0570 [Pirellulaceae bacterium]|nr:MAG: hypothetical protein KatS3mg110_0570 [Pirellulaceae bacterium]
MSEAPNRAEAFYDLLGQSRVLSDQQLSQAARLVEACATAKDAATAVVRAGLITAWQAQQLLKGNSTLAIGEGQFVLLEELAGWPWGRSYVAKARDGRRYQLRILAARWINEVTLETALLESIASTTKLDHPALRPFTICKKVGNRYLLLSRFDGELSLGESVRRYGPFGALAGLQWLEQLAQLLATLHDSQLSHGWLTPWSLFLSGDGQLAVTDLGLSPIVAAWASEKSQPQPHDSFLPRDERSPIGSAAGDLVMAGRTWKWLVAQERPTNTTENVPDWWKLGDEPSVQQELNRILERLCDLNHPEAIVSARMLFDVCREAVAQLSVNAATAPAATPNSPPQPAQAISSQDGAGQADNELDAAAADDGGVEKLPSSPVHPVVIVTQPKRRDSSRKGTSTPAEAESKVPVRAKRRDTWLLWACSIGLVATLLIVAGGLWWRSYQKRSQGIVKADRIQPPITAAPAPAEKTAKQEEASQPEPAQTDELPKPPPDPAHLREASAPEPPVQPEAPPENTPLVSAAGSVSDPSMPEPGASTGKSAEAPGDTVASTTPNLSPTAPASSTDASEPKATESPSPEPRKPVVPPVDLSVLPKAVSLPDVTSTEWTTLAPVKLDDEVPIYFELLGADRVIRNVTYHMDNARGGTEPRLWDVSLTEAPANTVRRIIGQFRLVGGKLDFRWMPEAADLKTAPGFANCLIKASSGSQQQLIRLREPQVVRPLKLDLDRATFAARYDLPNAPDPASCRWEILAVGQGTTYTLEPAGAVPAASGKQWILFGKKREEQNLAIHITVSLRGVLMVSGQALFQMGEDPSEEWLDARDRRATKALRTRLARELPPALENLKRQLDQYNSIPPNTITDRNKRQEFDRLKNLAKVDYDRVNDQWKRVQAVEQLCEQLNDQPLHFRLVFDVEGQTVELLRTEGAPAGK